MHSAVVVIGLIASASGLKRIPGLCASEIKHGRTAVIAATDFVVPELVRFPGYRSAPRAMKFDDVPAAWRWWPSWA